MAWNALVFYLSCPSAMFLVLNFDLWPLTTFPGVMRQPVLGIVWTDRGPRDAAASAFWIGVVAMRHGSGGVHGPCAGALHLRHDRGFEHAEGIAIRGAGSSRSKAC